jgi:hypothetical protein
MSWQGLVSLTIRAIGHAIKLVRSPATSEHHKPRMQPTIVLTARALSRLLLFLAPTASVASAEPVDYLKQIKPVLAERCYACHGALKLESGLRLDTAKLAIQGGDSGAAVEPGDADASLLIQRVTATDESERMPGEGQPLTSEQIAALRGWIDQGAPFPDGEKEEQDPREHWAFRPVVRPPVPTPSNASWVRNPIDAFIAANHQRQGLTPQVEATRSELVRRLYLDLIGLPPTLEELREVEADYAAGWYERLVDRLLARPQHGERWARHWMDIWRYSDWWGLGDQMRNSHPHIWHWRDWIVDSLNANVPYDEMIRSMLAADELYPNDLEKLRATGFLVRNFFLFNRNSWLEETVEHVGKGFLGLTMNCAKCHDHKFDPIEQADFYRMRAFFEPYYVRTDSVPNESDFTRDGIPRAFDGKPDMPTYLFTRGQETSPDKSIDITPGVPEILKFDELSIKPVSLPLEAYEPERRPWVIKSHVDTATKKLATAESNLVAAHQRLTDASAESLKEQLATVEKEAPPASGPDAPTKVAIARADVVASERAVALAAAELSGVKNRADAMQAHWAKTGDANAAIIEAERISNLKALSAERQVAVAKAQFAIADAELRLLREPVGLHALIMTELATARETLDKAKQTAASGVAEGDRFTTLPGAATSPTRFLSTLVDDELVKWSDRSTGRRKALAQWITDVRNPLTARVAVNHIWTRHMGTPLTTNAFDLGRNSPPPNNPELIDWLAAELIDSGWDMKHLHRLIVNSTTYRLSSAPNGHDVEIVKDPDNAYWWRRNTIRLESEVIRDSIVSLAGTLDPTMGGPPVPPAEEEASRRRSLYFFHSNNERNLFLTTFDLALVTECYRRNQSVVPQQALAMTNSKLVLESAKLIAEKLTKAGGQDASDGDDIAFIRNAFVVLLGIYPNEAELSASQHALDHWRQLPNANPDDVRANLVWSLLNHNDFITLR